MEICWVVMMHKRKSTLTTHVAAIKETFFCSIYYKRPVLVILGVITEELKNTRTISSFSCRLMHRLPTVREDSNIRLNCYDTEEGIEGVLQQLTKPLSKRPSIVPSSSKGQFFSSLGSTPTITSGWSATSPTVWLIDYQQREKRTSNFIESLIYTK